MTKDFRERGLVVNDRVEEYDGTTAVVRTEHLAADDIEFLRWRAERWMKLRHFWPTLSPQPGVRAEARSGDAAAHVQGQLAALDPRLRDRSPGVRAVPGDPAHGAPELRHLSVGHLLRYRANRPA